MTIAPDGRYAYVASPQIGGVSVIDTGSDTLAARIPASGFMIMPPAGPRAYLIGGGLSVIDTGTNAVTKYVPTDLRPTSGAISRDGRRLYLADTGETR